jgi:beta-N-acetylhexosaminidase
MRGLPRVAAAAPLIETASNALGRVVTGRELVDFPLNGRTDRACLGASTASSSQRATRSDGQARWIEQPSRARHLTPTSLASASRHAKSPRRFLAVALCAAVSMSVLLGSESAARDVSQSERSGQTAPTARDARSVNPDGAPWSNSMARVLTGQSSASAVTPSNPSSQTAPTARGARSANPLAIDAAAETWVQATFKKMSLEEKVGQLLVSSFESRFISTDSQAFDDLVKAVREYHVGGFHVFGASEPAPAVLLNPTYGTVTLGQPLEAASTLNRLQEIATIPLLNSADFETGVGFRIMGATTFPRSMAFGAIGDERLAFEAGRITAEETRAVGIHVNFAPVVDVNNNARNPVINTRSFGEDPALVGRLASAYVRGLQSAGVIATLKHFPGHGDTDVDSHLGMPVITHPRARLETIELPPFKAGIAAGVDAVMTGHIEMPALDPAADTPTTLSAPIVTGVLRHELGFRGLIYTDSMQMQGVTKMYPPGEAAVRAVLAGNDVVLHSPDDGAAFVGIRDAVKSGRIPLTRVDESVLRILRAKARVGLHQKRTVSLDALPSVLGTRAHQAVADIVSERSLTLIEDARGDVPLKLARDAQVLYLSVLDYPSGWRIAAPSRTFLPELKARWPNVTAIELSDRSTASEIELLSATVPRYDAVVASVFVRTASFSGRMDLAPALQRLLTDIAHLTAVSHRPFVTTFFGNPYAATFLPDLPAVLLTYDFYDRAERSAVRALAGEAPISGRLPITLPGAFDRGWGLTRAAASGASPR